MAIDYSAIGTEIATLESSRASDPKAFFHADFTGARPRTVKKPVRNDGSGVLAARALSAKLSMPQPGESNQEFADRMAAFARVSKLCG